MRERDADIARAQLMIASLPFETENKRLRPGRNSTPAEY